MAAQMEGVQHTQKTDFVVAAAAGGSGLLITLHPLVIMNISDHHTRLKMQHGSSQHILGAIIGIQSGRDIEIFNSYELPFTLVDGQMVLDKDFFISKQEQFKQVFPKYDLLGWYTTGMKPTQSNINVHNQFLQYNESALFLQLNPSPVIASKDLPIHIYESVIEITQGVPETLFVESPYKIETGEAERIAVDHVAHVSNAEAATGSSSLISLLIGQKNAVKMLHLRIQLLQQYIMDVEKGILPRDHSIMRQISSVCNRLPTVSSADFEKEFLTEQSDSILTSYLSAMTQGTNKMNELIDKINIIVAEKKMGKHRMGTMIMG